MPECGALRGAKSPHDHWWPLLMVRDFASGRDVCALPSVPTHAARSPSGLHTKRATACFTESDLRDLYRCVEKYCTILACLLGT